MKTDSYNKLKNIINNKIFKRIDHKILVYLVFVGISTVFWVLNELNNTYNATINYPIRFTHLPNSKSLSNNLPSNLQLSINADGYTILKYKLRPSVFPVIINMGKYNNSINSPEIKQFKLQTRYLRKSINKQMPNDIEIVDIFPDTVLFLFANMVEKTIPVKPIIKLEFNDGCMLDGEISTMPDSITVRGPNTILDTLKAIYTKHHTFTNLSNATQQNISLRAINKLEYSSKKVEVSIPSAKFTQLNFDIVVNAINVPDSLHLKTFPRMIKISCMVSLNDYDKIKADNFILEVDYLDIEHLLGENLSLNIKLAPPQVRSISYYPENVEFILDKKP